MKKALAFLRMVGRDLAVFPEPMLEADMVTGWLAERLVVCDIVDMFSKLMILPDVGTAPLDAMALAKGREITNRLNTWHLMFAHHIKMIYIYTVARPVLLGPYLVS